MSKRDEILQGLEDVLADNLLLLRVQLRSAIEADDPIARDRLMAGIQKQTRSISAMTAPWVRAASKLKPSSDNTDKTDLRKTLFGDIRTFLARETEAHALAVEQATGSDLDDDDDDDDNDDDNDDDDSAGDSEPGAVDPVGD